MSSILISSLDVEFSCVTCPPRRRVCLPCDAGTCWTTTPHRNTHAAFAQLSPPPFQARAHLHLLFDNMKEIFLLDFIPLFVRVCVCVCVCGKHEPYHLALETINETKLRQK